MESAESLHFAPVIRRPEQATDERGLPVCCWYGESQDHWSLIRSRTYDLPMARKSSIAAI